MTPTSSPLTAEGSIKFVSSHRNGPPPDHPRLAELDAMRTALYDLGLIGVTPEGIGYGNLSVRGEGTTFVITGSGTGGVRELSSGGYCLVTACHVDENRVESTGPVPASSESMSHAAVYEAFPVVQCVVHIHHPRLFAALLEQGFPHTPDDVAYGTPEMARAITELVRSMTFDNRFPGGIFVMAGHKDGVIAFGPDMASVQTTLVRCMV